MTARFPVPIEPVGLVSCATVVWRHGGELRVTAIAKATFTFAPDGAVHLASPEPIQAEEMHAKNNPTRSILAASDLASYVPAADVLLAGHAYAPGGSARRVGGRLALGRESSTILDKRIETRGAAASRRPALPFAPAPRAAAPELLARWRVDRDLDGLLNRDDCNPPRVARFQRIAGVWFGLPAPEPLPPERRTTRFERELTLGLEVL